MDWGTRGGKGCYWSLHCQVNMQMISNPSSQTGEWRNWRQPKTPDSRNYNDWLHICSWFQLISERQSNNHCSHLIGPDRTTEMERLILSDGDDLNISCISMQESHRQIFNWLLLNFKATLLGKVRSVGEEIWLWLSRSGSSSLVTLTAVSAPGTSRTEPSAASRSSSTSLWQRWQGRCRTRGFSTPVTTGETSSPFLTGESKGDFLGYNFVFHIL